jgi:membrane protease subunit (stomatin/prohibitin family)
MGHAKYNLMVPVRAFGQYGIRIVDSKKFLMKLVGTVTRFDVDTLSEYFKGTFTTRIKTEIANLIIKQGQSILEASTQLEVLSNELQQSLEKDVSEYGVTLAQFNVHSINVPENDPAVITLKAALAKKAEMGIVGFTYQQERSFDVMETAAGNEGNAGSVMGAGMGVGMGLGIGAPMGQAYGQMASQMHVSASPRPSAIDTGERFRLLKELAALKAEGILTEDEFTAEKKRILSS